MKNIDIFLILFLVCLISSCGSSGGSSAPLLPLLSTESSPITSTSRLQASYDYLTMDQDNRFTTDAFLPDINTQTLPPSHVFEGKLTITGTPIFALNYGNLSSLPSNQEIWPEFSYQFVQDNGRLITVSRGHGFVGTGSWSITAVVGAIWDEVTDNGYTRAAFPYTIKQKNANCEANGLATFLFNGNGSISNVHVQNVAETCQFYSTLNGQYQIETVNNKQQVI